ncbi:MAG: hypothetical protein K6E72_00340 [Saccharofermentans sp.]|nr:hypothetical protein [Saccharofermentans sp.]
MREDKKYEVLPGVEIPDINKIQEAASDFSVSDVGEVEIKTVNFQPIAQSSAPGVSAADLSQLQQLGNNVAEAELKAKAESRAMMDKIMHSVTAPGSIEELKDSHIAQVNAEKRKELEENMKAVEQQQAEEEAKAKAREERRQLQQRLLEESREKAAKEKAEKEAAEKEAAAIEAAEREKAAENVPAEQKTEKPAEQAEVPVAQAAESVVQAEVPAQKPEETKPAVKKTAKMVSDNEAFDDFREFLGDSDNQ